MTASQWPVSIRAGLEGRYQNIKDAMTMADGKTLSKVEAIKVESHALRGSIVETLTGDAPRFSDADYQLLKFHGSYQGYDRDSATERKKQGLDKAWEFMVRARIPGGRLTSGQYLALDRIAGDHANGTLRITTRQAIQYHGILKGDLKALIADINETLITTLGACGDVVRNIMAAPAPVMSPIHERIRSDARTLSDTFLPRTRAYHEIWLDGEKVVNTAEEHDPIYGSVYLPRKFKIAIATPDDNSVDALTNDVGLIAVVEDGELAGYNLYAGGGLGVTHNKSATYPRLATPVGFIPADDLIPAVRAVIEVQRDNGDRQNRKHARLKYLVEERGTAWFKAEVERYFGGAIAEPARTPPLVVHDHMGWHEQGDGRWYLGVPVPSGRVADTNEVRLRSGLRAVAARFQPSIVLMPTQDILFADVAESDKAAIEAVLVEHGIPLAEDVSLVDRWSMACPALPTCGLALTEAERVREPLVGSIREVMAREGVGDERLSIRITGCPNGCARPYAGDIGLVGRMPGHYALYLGGDFEGTRLSVKQLDRVREDQVAEVLAPIFAAFAAERDVGEGFGNFCHRIGKQRVAALLESALEPLSKAG